MIDDYVVDDKLGVGSELFLDSVLEGGTLALHFGHVHLKEDDDAVTCAEGRRANATNLPAI